MVEAIWKRWTREDVPLRVGVSGCLLGKDVRPDHEDCRDRFLVEELGPFVQWEPRCPEVELGLGVPRSPLELVVAPGGEIRLSQEGSETDLTQAMEAYARAEVESLEQLDGYILKKASPTCGMERVAMRSNDHGSPRESGVGVFARILQERWPDLPVEEDGRLNDPLLRSNFIERLFGHNRWRALLAGPRIATALEDFHGAHELLLRAHDPSGSETLGRLVRNAAELPVDELYRHYGHLYHETLRKPPAVRAHLDVMQLAMNHFRGILSPRDRRALRLALDDYGRGALPLVAPISLLRFHVEKHGLEDLARQVYLEPHPKELMARRSA